MTEPGPERSGHDLRLPQGAAVIPSPDEAELEDAVASPDASELLEHPIDPIIDRQADGDPNPGPRAAAAAGG